MNSPTHQEKLAFIRGKCIEANPEIVELKFGCRLEIDGRIWTILFEDHLYRFHVISVDKTRWDEMFIAREILYQMPSPNISRPIRLADVILMLESVDVLIVTRLQIVAQWDCRKDDLNEQDEATISFLHDILC